jgi:hypothetical protein
MISQARHEIYIYPQSSTRLSDQTIGYGDIVRDTYPLRLMGSHAAIEADKRIEPTRPDTLYKTQPIAFPRYPERGDDHVEGMVDRRATKIFWVISIELRARAKSPKPQHVRLQGRRESGCPLKDFARDIGPRYALCSTGSGVCANWALNQFGCSGVICEKQSLPLGTIHTRK